MRRVIKVSVGRTRQKVRFLTLRLYHLQRPLLRPFKIEPPRDKNQQMACASSEESDQPGIRIDSSESSLCAQWVAKNPSFLHADSEDSN